MKIAKVLLPANIKQADDDYDAVDWLGRFCGKLVVDGPYDWDDLPPIARAMCELDEYAGEVANGGHIQYLTNHHWKADEIAACREGFRRLGANSFESIFDAASEVIERDQEWLERFRAGDSYAWSETALNSIEAQLTPLDHRFFRDADGPGALTRLMRDALFASDDVGYSENVSKDIKDLLPPIALPKIPHDNENNEILRRRLVSVVKGACKFMQYELVGINRGAASSHVFEGTPTPGFIVETKQGDHILLFGKREFLFLNFAMTQGAKFENTFFTRSEFEKLNF